jgi:hypothetical protein
MSYFAAQIPPDLENKTHAPPIFARTALAGADDGVARFMGQLVHLWRQFGDGAIHRSAAGFFLSHAFAGRQDQTGETECQLVGQARCGGVLRASELARWIFCMARGLCLLVEIQTQLHHRHHSQNHSLSNGSFIHLLHARRRDLVKFLVILLICGVNRTAHGQNPPLLDTPDAMLFRQFSPPVVDRVRFEPLLPEQRLINEPKMPRTF